MDTNEASHAEPMDTSMPTTSEPMDTSNVSTAERMDTDRTDEDTKEGIKIDSIKVESGEGSSNNDEKGDNPQIKTEPVDEKPIVPKSEFNESCELSMLYKQLFLKDPTDVIDLNLNDRDPGQQQKVCINALCTSKGAVYLKPNRATLLFYSVPRSKNQFVCTECFKKAAYFFWEMADKIREEYESIDVRLPNIAEFIVVDDDEQIVEGKNTELLEKYKEWKKAMDCHLYLVKGDITETTIDSLIDTACSEFVILRESARELYKKIVEDQEELSQLARDLYSAYAFPTTELPSLDIPYEEMRSNFTDLVSLDENEVMYTGQFTVQGPKNLPPIGTLTYPALKAGDSVYSFKRNVVGEWVPCSIEDITTRTSEQGNPFYIYKLFIKSTAPTGFKKECSGQFIAYYDPPSVRVPAGTRIIAETPDPTEPSTKRFYAGLVAEIPSHLNKYRYLVFHDEGREYYVDHKSIRIVCDPKSNFWETYKGKYQQFVRTYFANFPERAMLKIKKLDSVKTEYKGGWVNARAIDLDCSLVKLLFLQDRHTEWIYRGSPRLHPMFVGFKPRKIGSGRPRALPTRGRAELPVHYTSVLSDEEVEENKTVSEGTSVQRAVARKSSTRLPDYPEQRQLYDRQSIRSHPAYQQPSDGIIKTVIPEKQKHPKVYRPHLCSPLCISWLDTKEEDTKNLNPLSIPCVYGFSRETDITTHAVSYISPCGRRLKTIGEVLGFLTSANLKLGIDCFDMDPAVNIFNEFVVARGCLLDDISFGVENIPIPCVNNLNNSIPPYMDYMTQRRGNEGVNLNLDPEFLVGCDCTDNCQDKTKCACWQLTLSEGNVKKHRDLNYEEVGYQNRRLLTILASGIYECNKRCKCCVKTCLNRVVQQPLKQKLQLFMTKNKGWGTRCLNDIARGTYICVYVGNIFTEDVANEDGRLYGDEYFAELDYIEVVESIKEDYEESAIEPDDDLNGPQNDTITRPSEEYMEPRGNARKSRKRRTKRAQTSDSEDEDDPDSMESDDSSSNSQMDDNSNMQDPASDGKPSVRTYFGKDESVYIMDAKAAGNIGRYLNHSCDPNIFVQNVFVDTHDLRFPWVAFFSLKNIPAGTELTWDYRYEVGSVPGKRLKCYCEAENCRGRLL